MNGNVLFHQSCLMPPFTNAIFLLFAIFASSCYGSSGSALLMDLQSRQVLILEKESTTLPPPLISYLKTLPQLATQPMMSETMTMKTLGVCLRNNIVEWEPGSVVESSRPEEGGTFAHNLWQSNIVSPITYQCDASCCYGIYLSRNPLSETDTRKLLVVLAGYGNESALFDKATDLLKRGNWDYANHILIRQGEPVGSMRVFKGDALQATLVTDKDIVVTLPKTRRADATELQKALTFRITQPTPVVAPIEIGAPLGQLTIELDGKFLTSAPLFALHPIGPGTFWRRLYDTIQMAMFSLDTFKDK